MEEPQEKFILSFVFRSCSKFHTHFNIYLVAWICLAFESPMPLILQKEAKDDCQKRLLHLKILQFVGAKQIKVR